LPSLSHSAGIHLVPPVCGLWKKV